MCLTCELAGNGYYKDKPTKRTLAEAAKRAASQVATSRRPADSDGEGADTPISTPRKTRRPSASVTDSMAATDDEENEEPERRLQPKRRAVLKAKKIDWSFGIQGRRRRRIEREETDTQAEDSESDNPGDAADAGRCLTCAAKTKSLWVRNQEFLLCQRCCRHAMIFLLPWPAHRRADVREYPPPHVLPRNYYPPQRVSQVELPTYLPKPRALLRVEQSAAAAAANAKAQALLRAAASDIPDTKEHRQARHRAAETARNEFDFDMGARSAWDKEEARREAQTSMAKARERAKAQRAETKRKLDEGKQKGVGLWNRYTTETHEQREERERKKYQFVSGTRSGRRIREASEGEAELEKLTREAMLKERNRELVQSEKQREWREREKARRRKDKGVGADSEADSDDELAELDELDDLEELNELGAAAADMEANPPKPDQGALQDKLLLAGGEEGEEDEEAENEALGREVGTARNPYVFFGDDDEEDDFPGSLFNPDDRVKQETPRTSPQQTRRRRSSRPVVYAAATSDSDLPQDLDAALAENSRPQTRHLDQSPLPKSKPFPSKAAGEPIVISSSSDYDSSDSERGNSPLKPINVDSDDEAPPVRPPRQNHPQQPFPERPGSPGLRPQRGKPPPGSSEHRGRALPERPAWSPEPAEHSHASWSQQQQPGNSPGRSWRQERGDNLASRAREARQLDREEVLPLHGRLSRRGLSEASLDEASPRDGASNLDDHEARSAESVERDIGSSSRARPDDSALRTPAKRRAYEDPPNEPVLTRTPSKRREYQDPPNQPASGRTSPKRREYQEPPSVSVADGLADIQNEVHKPRKKGRSFFRVQEGTLSPPTP